MKRDWCPSTSASAAPQFDTKHVGATDITRTCDAVSEHSAVAAHSGKSAFALGSGLHSLESGQKFSASLVASRTNKSLFPNPVTGSTLEYLDDNRLDDDSLAVYSEFFLNVNDLPDPCRLAIPADHITKILNNVIRQEAEDKQRNLSSRIHSIVALPSFSAVVQLDDIVDSLLSSANLVENFRSFTSSGTPLENGESLSNLLEKCKKLTEMSLVRCNVGPTSVQLLETLREREIEHLNLDGNDLGLPEYESEVIEPLADYLKFNKFLLSLNLSFNNLSVETVTSLIDALCESDTVLRPDDLPQEEEEEIPIEQLLDEAEAEEGEPSEEEEEELEVDEEGEPEETQEEGEAEEEEAEEKEEKSEEESDDEDAEEKLQEQARLAQEKLDKQYARLFRSLMKEEAKARKASEREYKHATAKVADYLTVIRAQKQADKEKKIAEFCARRSGWSRLQYVLLRGNNVGDRGAASLARLLQNTVDLNEDEVNQIDEQLREKINQLIAQLVEERGKTRLSEAKEWQSIQKEHAAVTDKAESGKDEEEDEYAKDAPQVVFSNIEGGESDEEGNEPDSPLIEAELEGIDCSGWSLDIHPIKSGMNSIVYLDLGSCGVGSKGLTALSETLQTNKVLTTLILRNNRFNTKFTKTKNEDGEVEQKEATDYVSPGFASLVKALGVNGTLAHLDLGYCNLQGSAVQLLASSLSGNSSLVTLCLEGNRLLASPPPDPTAESGSCLKNLLESITQSGIQHLNLSSMDLHEMLWQDESELLALLCQQLTSLYLNNTGISGGQLNRVYLSATESFTLQVLHLSRNQFVSEDDGQGVGLFLSQCVELSELCLDDHPKLSSRAVHEMFQNAPNSLSRLSCNRVGLSSAFVDSRPVFSADVLGNLSYLSLSDIDISSEAQLREWSDCIRSASSRLNVLSLWSRKVNMEECLGTCSPLVNGLATLLYADFGVLLRFDGGQDISDTLGQMELTLTQRRLSLNTM